MIAVMDLALPKTKSRKATDKADVKDFFAIYVLHKFMGFIWAHILFILCCFHVNDFWTMCHMCICYQDVTSHCGSISGNPCFKHVPGRYMSTRFFRKNNSAPAAYTRSILISIWYLGLRLGVYQYTPRCIQNLYLMNKRAPPGPGRRLFLSTLN